MVFAICLPNTHVTLLESIGKKARFLEETAKALGLKNVTVLAERAEVEGAADSAYREFFDMVTARAVAALPTLLEITIPFVEVGGTLLAMKGERALDELSTAKNALKKLEAEHIETKRQPTTTLLRFRKTHVTPARYPRRTGEPKRKPL